MVPNGVDSELFTPSSVEHKQRLRRKYGIPHDSVCIGFSGKQSSNTYNRKGIETFMAGVRSLASVGNVSLAIIGPGWDDVVRELKAIGLTCSYLPFIVDRREVANFYKAIDIYWVTSKIEGGPVPLLEAMSSGLPCVSTPVGVALEAIVSETNGFIAPFDAPNVYRDITERLIRAPDMRRRVGLAARQTILRQFQASETTRSVARLYDTAVQHFRSRVAQTAVPGSRVRKTIGNTNARGKSVEPLVRFNARMMAEEHLVFMDYLLSVNANKAAFRVGCNAILANPLCLETMRRTIRLFPKLHKFIRYRHVAYQKLAPFRRFGW